MIVKYDDQRLYSPEQFVKLVQNNKPNREIKLRVIHDDKAENLEVTIGERAAEHLAHSAANANGRVPLNRREARDLGTERRSIRELRRAELDASRQNNFKAEIKYRDKNGKVETHNFQGSREQLSKDITGEKNIPTSERNQLLTHFWMRAESLDSRFPRSKSCLNTEPNESQIDPGAGQETGIDEMTLQGGSLAPEAHDPGRLGTDELDQAGRGT